MLDSALACPECFNAVCSEVCGQSGATTLLLVGRIDDE